MFIVMKSKENILSLINIKILKIFFYFTIIGNGYYMYLEASNTFQGSKSLLQFAMPNVTGNVCLQFHYHMYSSSLGTMGNLNVRSVSNSSALSITIANINGNQGNLWKRFQFQAQIPSGGPPIKVRSEGLIHCIILSLFMP